MGHGIQEYIANLFDHRKRLLSLVEGIPQSRINSNDVLNIPKNSRNEFLSCRLKYDIRLLEGVHPYLGRDHSKRVSSENLKAYVTKVLQISHKVTLSINDFIDSLLTPFLCIRNAIENFLRYRVNP
jgi:hypothetical protein